MKCARKYSETSSYVLGRSPYEEMLDDITESGAGHSSKWAADALFPHSDTSLQLLFQEVRLPSRYHSGTHTPTTMEQKQTSMSALGISTIIEWRYVPC